MQQLKAVWYPFEEHPDSDTCWSISTGPDGRVYIAACSEREPGQTVKVCRYNESEDGIDYLFDLDKAVEDPRDSGRATQCKIHYSFAPSPKTNIIYMATHLSGPPVDQLVYSPWGSWHDQKRCFRGAALIAYDTDKDQIAWWDTLYPKEGCRCLLLDDTADVLYSVSYPRDHMFAYDLKTRSCRDLGRIGSINAQVLFTDSQRRIWTADDYGILLRYDPAIDRIERTPLVLPYDQRIQTGWHNVLYDAVAFPEQNCVYAVTWNIRPRLMRIFPDDGEWGRVEDLGPVNQPFNPSVPASGYIDHAGGLVVGNDRKIYFCGTRWDQEACDYRRMDKDPEHIPGMAGILWRLDPYTLEKEEVLKFEQPDADAHYVSRGAIDRNGNFFFGSVSPFVTPTGIFRVEMPQTNDNTDGPVPLRMWG